MPTIREVRYKGCFLSGLGTDGNIFNLCLLFDGNSELFCDLFLHPGGFGTATSGESVELPVLPQSWPPGMGV